MADVKVKLRIAEPADKTAGTEMVTFNTRIVAAMIDLIVAIGLVIGLIWILPGLVIKLAYLTGAAYLIARDSLPFLGGQSVGKKAMGIKVVTLDGKSLVGNWQAALIRNGVLIIPFFGLIEIFILLTREETPSRGRRLGDEWAKTKLMAEKKPVAGEGTDGMI
ncbi:MAG TPA: RDD family protein [Luteolibacter sp.]